MTTSLKYSKEEVPLVVPEKWFSGHMVGGFFSLVCDGKGNAHIEAGVEGDRRELVFHADGTVTWRPVK